MTIDNDANDEIARAAGWDVVDHPAGRRHDHSRYRKRKLWVWRTLSGHDGPGWMSAVLRGPTCSPRYTGHRRHATLEDALSRTDTGARRK